MWALVVPCESMCSRVVPCSTARLQWEPPLACVTLGLSLRAISTVCLLDSWYGIGCVMTTNLCVMQTDLQHVCNGWEVFTWGIE